MQVRFRDALFKGHIGFMRWNRIAAGRSKSEPADDSQGRGEACKWKYARLTEKYLEVKPMKEALEKAIKLLAEKITTDIKSDDALRFTQAALNLEHALQVKTNIENQRNNPTHGV